MTATQTIKKITIKAKTKNKNKGNSKRCGECGKYKK